MRKYTAATFIIAISGCQITKGASIDTQVSDLISHTMANLVTIEGGEFRMGDVGVHVTEDDGNTYFYHWDVSADSRTVHKVRLDTFKMARYEVTFEEFDLYLKRTKRRPEYLSKFKWRDNLPAAAHWRDAKAYCRWLSNITALPFDLPTEAQWEYAARSKGLPVGFATDDGTLKVGRNYHGYSDNLKPVGQLPPNAIGLYDMSGNSAEWVNDWYNADYYSKSPIDNPPGPLQGSHKILRGGSIANSPAFSNVYGRHSVRIDFTTNSKPHIRFVQKYYGFRCVVNQ